MSEIHEQQWGLLEKQEDLVWSDFPWLVLRVVSSAGELTDTGAIGEL